MKEDRGGKVFVDATRVGGATVVAAYSPRARPGHAGVVPGARGTTSTSVAPADFTIHTALDRLGDDDPWAASMPDAAPSPPASSRRATRSPAAACRRCTRASAGPGPSGPRPPTRARPAAEPAVPPPTTVGTVVRGEGPRDGEGRDRPGGRRLVSCGDARGSDRRVRPGWTGHRRRRCRWSAGGLMFVAKDNFDVAGHVTGAGNPDWRRTHEPATHHGAAITRLVDAGASMVARTVMDELAYSLLGINAHDGTPVNPVAPDSVPGGSSSGSAAATAAGLVDFALGSDTGGSVRVPAGLCGTYGFRPTHGVVSTDGMVGLAPSFDTVGWFARESLVLWQVASVLLGPDPGGLPPQTRMIVPDDVWDAVDEPVVDGAAPGGAAARRAARSRPARTARRGGPGVLGRALPGAAGPRGLDAAPRAGSRPRTRRSRST